MPTEKKTEINAKRILARARDHIGAPNNFVRGHWFKKRGRGGASVNHSYATVGELRQGLQRAEISLGNPDCKVCAEGAVYLSIAQELSIPDDELLPLVFREAIKPLEQTLLHRGPGRVPGWNDNTHTKKADIVKKFDKAVEQAPGELDG